jgi:hypothetical protein
MHDDENLKEIASRPNICASKEEKITRTQRMTRAWTPSGQNDLRKKVRLSCQSDGKAHNL